MHGDVAAVVPQLADDVLHPRVAQIGAVLLEGQPQHGHFRPRHRMAAADQLLHRLFGDELAHAVVGLASAQHHLRVVADALGLVGEVVRVHADAVAAHQAGAEGQEVPLGAGGLQHVQGVDAQLVEDQCQLIHQGDIEVALGVLDDLGGFGHLDAGGAVHPRRHHRFVQGRHPLQGRRGVTGHHLGNGLQPVHLVARVDALGGIADEEPRGRLHVHPVATAPGEPRPRLQQRHADFLGAAGVNGGFKNDHSTGLQIPGHGARGALQRTQVRAVGVVDGGGHHHDNDGCLCKLRRVTGVLQPRGRRQRLAAHFPAGVAAGAILFQLAFIEVEANGAPLATKGDRQRQPDITQTHNGYGFVHLLFTHAVHCAHSCDWDRNQAAVRARPSWTSYSGA